MKRLLHRLLCTFLTWECMTLRNHEVARNKNRTCCYTCGWWYRWED